MRALGTEYADAPPDRLLWVRSVSPSWAAMVAASPHRLRHGLAYRLLESGASPAYVAKLLGHRRISTALRYGNPTETDLRLAMTLRTSTGVATIPDEVETGNGRACGRMHRNTRITAAILLDSPAKHR